MVENAAPDCVRSVTAAKPQTNREFQCLDVVTTFSIYGRVDLVSCYVSLKAIDIIAGQFKEYYHITTLIYKYQNLIMESVASFKIRLGR